MSSTACSPLVPDSSVYVVSVNTTYTHYSCRSGYRYSDGDHRRACNVNGTWTGQALLCVVDSVMPKTYLVILIVGATIAIFVACIPYDFYRFRKRKKKVRDHQERLSLVTRIAPSHATVMLDTEADAAKAVPEPPRRFGFKSLFSVFRFVGGKLKTTGDTLEDSKSNTKCDTGKNKTICEEGSSNTGADSSCGNESGSSGSGGGGIEKSCSSGDGGVDSDMPTASTFVLNPHHSGECPVGDEEIIDLSGPSSYGPHRDLIHQTSISPDETSDDYNRHLFEQGRDNGSCGNSYCSLTSSGKVMSSITHNSTASSRSITPIHVRSNTSINTSTSLHDIQSTNKYSASSRKRNRKKLSKSVSDAKMSAESLNSNSNPATVEVTPITSSTSSPSVSSSKINGETDFPVYLPPPPPTSSSSVIAVSASIASSSSPNLCRERWDDRSKRTFHSQMGGESSTSYHSMPSISDGT